MKDEERWCKRDVLSPQNLLAPTLAAAVASAGGVLLLASLLLTGAFFGGTGLPLPLGLPRPLGWGLWPQARRNVPSCWSSMGSNSLSYSSKNCDGCKQLPVLKPDKHIYRRDALWWRVSPVFVLCWSLLACSVLGGVVWHTYLYYQPRRNTACDKGRDGEGGQPYTFTIGNNNSRTKPIYLVTITSSSSSRSNRASKLSYKHGYP